MEIQSVRVVLTMDCERMRTSEFYPAGPASWQESARNISAFAAAAEHHDFKVTFFAVPEAIEAHVDLFKGLLAAGHEVGLHLHPHTFRDGVNEYLGNLPHDRQFALIAEAKAAFEAAMGFPPTSFRPGHFSANADTFRVLSSLGFLRGSSAIPGRYVAGTGGDWRNWSSDCQYVNGIFEVPVTVHQLPARAWRGYAARHAWDMGRRGFWTDALRMAVNIVRGRPSYTINPGTIMADLRIEDGSYSLTRAIIDAEIARAAHAKHPAVVTVLTHSYINYSHADEGRREHGMSRQAHLMRMLAEFGDRGGVSVQSETLSEAQRDFEAGVLNAPKMPFAQTISDIRPVRAD